MIKLIKLLITFTIYLQFKEHCAACYSIAIIQGKSLNFGQSDYPRTPQDTPGHPKTLRDSIICIFNMLYERVDDVFVLVCSIIVMWLYLFACNFSILELSLFV